MPGTTAPVLIESLVVDFLHQGISVEFEVTGGSMAPFIKDHDIVAVEPVGVEGVGFGDVVVWTRSDDRLVVHRVIAEGGGFSVTRGDALRFPDGRIGHGQLIGKVTEVRRNGLIVRWGLGPERLLLGRLSRMGVLAVVLRGIARLRIRVS